MNRVIAILSIAVALSSCTEAPVELSYNPEAGAYGVGTLTLPAQPCGRNEAVLLIHGGGWSSMDRASIAGVAEHFTSRLGLATFNIEYTLAGAAASGKAPWPACGNDCLKAAEWMFGPEFAEAAGFTPEKIWICGASAGGHLALWTGLKMPSDKVAGIISISGIADPEPDFQAHPKRYRTLFGGHDPSAEELGSMSIMNLVRPGGPKILLTHEYQDGVVPIESARRFLWAYRNAGNDIGLCEYSRNDYEGLGGHCIWIPGSKPHRLIPKLEREIGYFVSPPAVPEPRPVGSDFNIFALYYPGTEHMPEWDMVDEMFPGRRPLLGWYDEGDPENVDWQVKWAVENGIRGFCVDWYWNDGRRRLEHWVQAFYRSKRRGAFKWYMMYANHNQPGSHNEADQRKVTRYWLDNYFKTPEYYRIDGKPVVCIWSRRRIDEDFIAEAAALGEVLAPGEGIRRAFEISEEMVRSEGLPGIHWQDMWRSNDYDEDYARGRASEGYSSAISYGFDRGVWKMAPDLMGPQDGPQRFSFDVVAAAIGKKWDGMCRQTVLPYAIALPSGWDDRSRSFQRGLEIYGRTPEKFASICRAARRFCEQTGSRDIIIHPLNEWQEGSYLEPNREYGFGMYEAVRDAFCSEPKGGWPRNMTPAEAGCKLHEFPPSLRSSTQRWDFDDSVGGWYRQPYGGVDVEWHDGILSFVITRTWAYNIRQKVRPFAASRYKSFSLRMKITPNALYGLGDGSEEMAAKLMWGTRLEPIINGFEVDEHNSVSVPVLPDGQWHEYSFDLTRNPGWKGRIDELWFKACPINHARVEIDWMGFD